jgi:phosphopantothenoylcysteine decarboxylase/phosphopantothenate--cysteine ligase
MPLTVIVGVSGGIAAYNSAYLVSALGKKGFDVHALMTRNALNFVGAVTFETLTSHAVLTDTFERIDEFDVKHVSLAKKADMLIIAPATADIIAKAAAGIADDMLTTTLLACDCPVIFAPAMNDVMYADAATQNNISLLKKRGYFVMDTGTGLLACGDVGQGRMREPEEIIGFAMDVLVSRYDLLGIRMLISAGPTREMIDPVRFLSNRSTGKMGYAIAQAAIKRGANVTLVSGPVALEAPQKAKVINVTSAADMADTMLSLGSEADIIVMAAAVADYTPKTVNHHKIKKSGDMTLEFVRTKDILLTLGETKKSNQLLMGFAAETQDFEGNATEKMRKKNLDVIALNDVSRSGEGFESDSNNIVLYFQDGTSLDLGSDSKKALSQRIIDVLAAHYQKIIAR